MANRRAQLKQSPHSETLKHRSMFARVSQVRAARHPTFTARGCLIRPGF